MRNAAIAIIRAIGVDTGGANVQFAINPMDGRMLVIEMNPRASRTIPFIAKTTGVAWVNVAVKCMLGVSLKQQGMTQEITPFCFAVKESVLPFVKLPGSSPLLGPEMKSTGEVMGMGASLSEAFIKSQLGAGFTLPKPFNGETVLITAFDGIAADKQAELLNCLDNYGFNIMRIENSAQEDTKTLLQRQNITFIIHITKQHSTAWLNVLQCGLQHGISYTTTLTATNMLLDSLAHAKNDVMCLQSLLS